MWKKIVMIVVNVLGMMTILGEISTHISYENWALKEYGGKFAPGLIQQHLYSAVLMIGAIVAIMAMLTYVLRKKPQ